MFDNKVLGLFFDSLPDALLICLNDGTMVRSNTRASVVLGYQPEELIGRNIDIFLPDHLKEHHKLLCKTYLENPIPRGMGETQNLKVRRKDQSEIPVSIGLSPIGVAGESMIVICIRDNSIYFDFQLKKRKVEEKIQQAQKLESLGVMSAGIAHDFNNFLHIIRGNIELILSELPGESPFQSNIEDIEAAAYRLSELTHQILTFSGGKEVEEKNINVSLLVEEMMRLLQVSISKKIDMKYNLLKNPPNIVADPIQLRQIILNFIVNAGEAIGNKSGAISVSTGLVCFNKKNPYRPYIGNKTLSGKYIYIEVSDTGVGMQESIRSKLFDPFFSTKNTGRGLGLSIVHGIVDAHRGALEVHSEEHNGSTFKVFLPCSKIKPGLLSDSSSNMELHCDNGSKTYKQATFH